MVPDRDHRLDIHRPRGLRPGKRLSALLRLLYLPWAAHSHSMRCGRHRSVQGAARAPRTYATRCECAGWGTSRDAKARDDHLAALGLRTSMKARVARQESAPVPGGGSDQRDHRRQRRTRLGLVRVAPPTRTPTPTESALPWWRVSAVAMGALPVRCQRGGAGGVRASGRK
jgi:hypothetical protein